MKTLHTVKPEAPRVFLAGIKMHGGQKSAAAGDNGGSANIGISAGESTGGIFAGGDAEIAELYGLAQTLDLNITGAETFKVREASSRYGMGSGKAREVADKALAAGAECIIFDQELSPSQQRNWEELSTLAILDRQELIIRIFASRARTKEAELQSELAQLLYALPRLSHKYIDLNRQRGGRFGTRGEGETRLETDRRKIRDRIVFLRKEIEVVRQNRALQRRQRKKQEAPVCALVGYTNAGKSSLHRALTGSDVFVEDKLFATLDPTARKVNRLTASGARKNIIFVDTVGFIRRLPHNLVDAFRSTLEEAAQADLLLHVADISDSGYKRNNAAVLTVLGQLGAGDIPRITALNKVDLYPAADWAAIEAACADFPAEGSATVPVSAKNRDGLDGLWRLIEKALNL